MWVAKYALLNWYSRLTRGKICNLNYFFLNVKNFIKEQIWEVNNFWPYTPKLYLAKLQWSVNQYLGIGKYLFILQISIMYRFMDNSLISISILSIKKYLLKYWYFQYFTVPFLKSHESFISRVFMKFNTPEASSTHSERLFIGEN
mgnify:CR=1 FL=1